MNGGLIFESNTQLPSAPVLKQELITEHYAISAKRKRAASKKDKMNRPPNINTSYPIDHQQPQLSPFMPGTLAPPGAYPVYGNGAQVPTGYYQQPPPGFYVYPHHQQQQPQQVQVPGPSRRPSHPTEFHAAPVVGYPHAPGFDPAYGHPQHGQWDTASVSSTASSHKRKRSSSSQLKEELRTPRKSSIHSLPDVDPRMAAKQRGMSGSQLPTPPSTGGNVSTPSTVLYDAKMAALEEGRKHGVYVTTTEEEGRKLSLVQSATGAEAMEEMPVRGPPRTKTATTLFVNASGVATVGDNEVLQSDLALLDKKAMVATAGDATASMPQTPNANNPRTPSADANDSPGTKKTKMERRLDSFNPSARPSEPMFSIKLDMGQGQPCRVALRKDLALAFVGLDKATQVVEETRGEAQDGWTVNGEPGSRPPKRPDWPDEEAPWKIGSGGRRARQLREEKERTTLLRRYLESTSDDEDDDDGAGRFPAHRGKNAIRARPLPTATGAAAACDAGDNNPSDARAALLSTLNKGRRHPRGAVIMPTGVVACVCKQTVPSGSMVSCSSCKTWHHLGCVGLDEVQLVPNWVCDPCVAQARRATLSTPARSTPSAFALSSAVRSSAFRGNQTVALAPSPKFAGEAARAAGGGGAPLEMRTPSSPNRRRQHRGRVLSYGGDLWGVGSGLLEEPLTPVPPPRIPVDQFSTPRVDDSLFDVNSTPSRHLDTDPRMGGQFSSLFAMTPLMGRSRHTNQVLVPGDTPMGQPTRARLPFTDGIAGRHEFLQGLTSDRRAANNGPATERPARTTAGAAGGFRLGSTTTPMPASPSPFGHRRNHSGSLSHIRSGSRSGLGLGMPLDEEPEEDEEDEADEAVRFESEE